MSGESKDTTYGHQEDLLPLPVPPLEQTLEKYLKSVKPFLTDEEYEHTEAVVDDFRQHAGPELQAQLEQRGGDERNWLEDWWEQFAYMMPRYPAAININWHGVLPGAWGSRLPQHSAAALLTHGIGRVQQELESESFPVDMMGPQKLCMNQYRRMFNSCRIPGEFMDDIETYDKANHIVCLRNNHIFTFDILDENRRLLPLEVLDLQFRRVIDLTTSMFDFDSEAPVSVLTSENRTAWYKAREHLMELDPMNVESLEVIQTALFAVSLDEGRPTDLEEVARACLHGDGRNKWFDKPFNLIIFANGRGGINGEHAWADAIVVVNAFSRVLAKTNEEFRVAFESGGQLSSTLSSSSPAAAAIPAPRKLGFKLDAQALGAIEAASTNISKLISGSDLCLMQFKHFGKDFIKRYRIIPDFFVQMAIQLTYYRLFGKCVATYETGHTRAFYHGRTETVRSCSEESVAFVTTMSDRNASDGDRFNALKAAVDAHLQQVKGCMMGQGIDRHLMGLQILASMNGISPRPAIFTDKAARVSSTFKLSTSNIGSSPMFGGFSPFSEEGIGVCYGIRKDMINFSIVASRNFDATDAKVFREALARALVDMQQLLLTRNVMYIGKNATAAKL